MIMAYLDNSMIVTSDSLKVYNNSLRESVVNAIIRAEGYRY
jgi:hypothetical protein